MGIEHVQDGDSSLYCAWVVYVQPTFDELKRQFPVYVNPDYEVHRFLPIDRCKCVPTSAGDREVTFTYFHMGRDATTEDVLLEMDGKGLRPALYEELICFAKKYPDEQRKYPIVALGSEMLVDKDRLVAYIRMADLYLFWIGSGWEYFDRFLAVRK